MKYLSVCSGIEAATVAWHPLEWSPVAFSELEKFPASVLQHHYPHVPNLGDMTKYKEWNLGQFDLLVGGTPCQSFSVAGLRKGLADERGNLALVYIHILQRYQPRWFVWENVPGVLSSNGGRDFGTFLGAVAELGYGFAYRVLDAQYVRTHFFRGAVPQRRRRVFVVGYLGDWRRAAAVLFERESLSGNPAPSRKAGERVAGTLKGGSGKRGYPDPSDGNGGGLVDASTFAYQSLGNYKSSGSSSSSLKATGSELGVGCESLICIAHGQANAEIQTERSPALTCNHEAPIVVYGIPGNWIGRSPENGGNAVQPMRDLSLNLTSTDRHAVCYPINTMAAVGRVNEKNQRQTFGIGEDGDPQFTLQSAHSHAVCFGGDIVAFAQNQLGEVRVGDVANTLNTNSNATGRNTPKVQMGKQVRRLTPMECERLQGFPDGYTDIRPKGKPTPDSPRYKALGNSMAVNVMQWIGMRIQAVERLTK